MKNMKKVGASNGGLDSKGQEVFNPETLLSSIIDKIKEYNAMSNETSTQSDNQGPSNEDDDSKESGNQVVSEQE